MADRSAAVLADVLVADDPRAIAAALVEQLAWDPPLAVWAACTACQRDQRRLHTAADAAEWIIQRASVVLQWDPPNAVVTEPADVSRIAAFADQVAEDLTLAHLAACITTRDAQQTYFDALMHNAPRWFALVGDMEIGLGEQSSYPALPSITPEDVSPHVIRAAAILSDDAVEESIGRNVEASRRRGAEGRELWLQSVPGVPRCLPTLAAKLARLALLEVQFQATLETEKLESLAEFAAGAGHEINNPLAIIAGRAQLLLAGEADPERRRDLAQINAQASRAHEMLADLWLFARPPRPEPQSMDLVALVDRVIKELGPQAAERGVSVSRVGERGPLTIDADPVQLGVAIAALGKNALEAIGRDGQIEIGVDTVGDDVRIRVLDTGPGIAPDERRHIFDPFYSARQAGRGIGMGLSKCWRIVTGHGGRIAVHSEPGDGAEFVVTLPRKMTG
jgi:signal transduction histidine kinase